MTYGRDASVFETRRINFTFAIRLSLRIVPKRNENLFPCAPRKIYLPRTLRRDQLTASDQLPDTFG